MTFTFHSPRKLEADEINPWNNLLGKALASYNALTDVKYREPTLKEALLKSQQYNQYYGPDKQSQIGLRNAQTGAIPSMIALREAQTGAIPSQIALHQAQTNRTNQLANLPFGGQLAGPAKEAFALELLKQQYGEDSPVYKNAQHAYETNISSKEGLTEYRGSLANTANKRASTSLAKTAQELEEINQGFMPGSEGQIKLTPEQQQSMQGQYQLKMQKDITDVQTRQKLNVATNIDKTIDSVDPKILSKPAGIKGSLWLKKQESLAPLGKESEEYRKYKENLSKVNLLAKQVRQFYGESIQPIMAEKIEKMTNPASWASNPEIAMREYNAFTDLLKKETDTYFAATKKPFAREEKLSDPLGIR
jgi:hypothetical protein